MLDIQLVLVDPNPILCRALQIAFSNLPNVTIVPGRFEELASFDCMVSAANSFGLMDVMSMVPLLTSSVSNSKSACSSASWKNILANSLLAPQ